MTTISSTKGESEIERADPALVGVAAQTFVARCLRGQGTTETASPFLSLLGGGEGHRASELNGRVFLDGPPRSPHFVLRAARDRTQFSLNLAVSCFTGFQIDELVPIL